MAKFRIIQDQEKCISCGACVTLCPAYFAQDDETMKVKLKGGKLVDGKLVLEVDELKSAKEAAESCAVEAITIEKKEKK